jgi:hypothetical protein
MGRQDDFLIERSVISHTWPQAPATARRKLWQPHQPSPADHRRRLDDTVDLHRIQERAQACR